MAAERDTTGKGYDDETTERIRAVAKELLAKHGGKALRLAKAIGVSQATISRFTAGDQGIGPQVAKKLARAAGVKLSTLTGESDELPRVTNAMLPGWETTTRTAMRESGLPVWTFELAGLREAISPDVNASVAYVKAEAMLALQFSSEADARRRTNAEVDAGAKRK